MNPLEGQKLAISLMRKYKLIGWKFRWLKSGRVFGVCHHKEKIIGLSHKIVEMNKIEDVKDTILHEIAHALVGKKNGHNKIWQTKCVELGIKPERCYDTDKIKIPYNYIYECPNCKHKSKSLRYREQIACRKCCDTYNKGKWSSKFIFKMKEVKK